jgi:hypothetical protein
MPATKYKAISAVAIGNNAGYTGQGISSVAIGNSAGTDLIKGIKVLQLVIMPVSPKDQQQWQLDKMPVAALLCKVTMQWPLATVQVKIHKVLNQLLLDYILAKPHKALQSVAVGKQAGQTTQGAYSVAVGDSAGTTTQGIQSVAVGTTSWIL